MPEPAGVGESRRVSRPDQDAAVRARPQPRAMRSAPASVPPPAAAEAADTTARGPYGPVDAKAASGANGSPTPALTLPPVPRHPAGPRQARRPRPPGRAVSRTPGSPLSCE